MNELTDVKRKIRALSSMTMEKGASEAEAMLAMKKVGELLLQYNLSMDEVSLRDEPCVTKFYATHEKRRNVNWHVFRGIEQLCGVKVWFQRNRFEGIRWYFFGLESDVDMAIYLSELCQKSEKASTAEFRKTDIFRNYDGGHRRVVTNNFRAGFGDRLNQKMILLARERLEAEKKAAAFHAEAAKDHMVPASDEAKVKAAEAKTGTALICVAKEKLVAEEFAKRGPKLRTEYFSSSARYHGDARAAGSSAADRVNLSRPLGGGSKTSGLLR